jgi:hypothetical protein
MSYASNQRNTVRQTDLRSQLGRVAQRGNNIPKLLQQAQQQGNTDKVNRILRSSGVDPNQLQQVLASNSNNMQAVQNIIQQAGQGDLPQGALLVLNRESFLLVNAPEGTLLAASDQNFLLGGENNDNGVIAANDEGFLYVQDNQTGNADVYQFNGAPNGAYNGYRNGGMNGQYNADYQAGTWGDDENMPIARAQGGYNWDADEDYARRARRARSTPWQI